MKKVFKFIINEHYYLIILLLLFPVVSFAGVVLQWDQNDDADYYIVYWGDSPGDYSEGYSVEISDDVTQFSLSTPTGGKRYYYAVKAFNRYGNSSDFSDEVEAVYYPGAISIDEVKTANYPGADYVGSESESDSGCFVDSACE